MKKGRFLSNIYDPRKEDAKRFLTYSYDAISNGEAAMENEWQQHLKWVNQNIIDRPQATDHYTVEQLENMGMVGIYAKE